MAAHAGAWVMLQAWTERNAQPCFQTNTAWHAMHACMYALACLAERVLGERAGELAAPPLMRQPTTRSAAFGLIARLIATMSAAELAEQVQRLAEGLRARLDGESARVLADEVQQLMQIVGKLQQIESGEQERQQLHR